MMKPLHLLALFLLWGVLQGYSQNQNVVTYDFTDGTIISAKQSADGKLTLSGDYIHHSANYGLNLKVDQEIKISVDGSATIRFLGSEHSGLNMLGTDTSTGTILGEHTTKVTNDLVDTYDFVYSGPATTLSFKTVAGTGNDTYLASLKVIPSQEGIDFTTPETNIVYHFDLRDERIVSSSDPGNTVIEKGLFKIEAGCCNAYGYHGTQHGINFKDGNIITLQVAGNSYIRFGGDQYSGGTINASSATGELDIASQSNKTASTYSDSDPVWADFLYVGGAGTVVFENTGGTSYVPYIEIAPVPFDVDLASWTQRTGTVTINDVILDFTSGADASKKVSIGLSSGTVVSATKESASILVDLGGQPLDSFTPEVSGDIASVSIDGDVLTLKFTDDGADPATYNITVKDNSTSATAETGKTYTYNFADGSELPQESYSSLRYDTFQTNDGIVTINSNTDEDNQKFGYHDSTHGIVMFPGNSVDMIVAGHATISFIVCTYGSAVDAVFEFTGEDSDVLGTIPAQNIGGSDAYASSFTYTGPSGKITATLKSADFPTAEVYIHGLVLENAARIEPSNDLADVWDFGATQLDESQYNNILTEDIINSWYDESITPGSAGNVLPSFSAGVLSWVGGSNDRLRTSNTNLTRYDENLSGVTDFNGRIYVNGAGATSRYLSLTLSEDDEVTIWGLTQSGSGNIHFEYVADPDLQDDVVPMGGDLTELNFVAKAAGTYHIYDDTDKPSYFRVVRKDASYVTLTGNIDVNEAPGLPDDYTIVFTNQAGKTWSADASDETYEVKVPIGHQYNLSLEGANGYLISNGTTLDVTESTSSYDIAIQNIGTYTVSGSIVGLGDNISDLTLTFTPDPDANSIYEPQPVLDPDSGNYSVQLEPNIEYTIEAQGVNDYYIPENTLQISAADTTYDIVFETKPLQDVTIVANGLNDIQKDELVLTFTNLNEPEYSYTFSDINTISLREGVYELTASGLDKYPLKLAVTPNLNVQSEAVTQTLDFENLTNWTFDDADITASTEFYKGLEFTGNIRNEKAKGHLVGSSGGTIAVPLQPGQKMVVTYYYAADFSIDGGDAITTSSNSTSQLEYVTYVYPNSEAGSAIITINATTYITNIEVIDIVPYSSEITVGVDKDYQTINDALEAISTMDRPDDERVTVLIDPGNYEEMLVINENNITLKNAASIPSIQLMNEGVEIAPNAVRVTSYYGHGYNYFSQGTDNKWHEDVLDVNKANGYQPYDNVSGTTNGSYWNATLVVSADGFIAEDLIIENSFNQYISKKESEDIVVMVNGNKGERPTDYGNTSVQNRSFVERAAAIGIAGGSDKIILDECLIVGRQDTFFGGSNSRVVIYKGAVMGAVDYIFGGMTAVFYKTDLVLNTSDASGDAAYITAAQQRGERGFLMYETNVISTEPGVNTASTEGAKPGFFGRPWQANTSEVVFYNTFIDVSTYPGFEGESLINPDGWRSSLGGESNKMYEYGTVEASGENHMDDRVSWSTVLDTPVLNDGTQITTFNFTKGNDGWDPISSLEANDDTDNDGILDVNDNCSNTPNPDQADIDNDGIGDVCDDSDGDGVVDSADNCPDSPEGATVDVSGCELLDLAADNYIITVHDISCNGNNDGKITVSAENTDYTYNVSLSGAGTGSATLSSSNEFSENIENLMPGTYDICITVDGREDYEQCFRVSIEEPTPLAAYSSVNTTNNTVAFSLNGASAYTIDHNGEVTTTTQSRVVLDLQKGTNKFFIYTDSECQGRVYKEVFLSEEVVVFPNPTKGNLKVYINGSDTKINFSLSDLNGKKYMSQNMDVPADRVIHLDLTDFSNGVYFLLLKSGTVSKSIKIIKS